MGPLRPLNTLVKPRQVPTHGCRCGQVEGQGRALTCYCAFESFDPNTAARAIAHVPTRLKKEQGIIIAILCDFSLFFLRRTTLLVPASMNFGTRCIFSTPDEAVCVKKIKPFPKTTYCLHIQFFRKKLYLGNEGFWEILKLPWQ